MSGRRHLGVLALVLGLGVLITCWRLGSTGVVDETPPLFAAAGRAMTETGDWLTPRVNGLPRFDKPPLVYWLMALGYSLPGQMVWDPLGSWSARLPSALSSVAVASGEPAAFSGCSLNRSLEFRPFTVGVGLEPHRGE